MNSDNFTTIQERLKAFLETQGINNSEFGRRIGVSSSYITSMRKSIQPEKLERISKEFPNLNLSWLLTGNGDMLKCDTHTQTDESQFNNEEDIAKMVPVLPIACQGGSLNDFVTSVNDSDCEMVISPVKAAEFAMPVSGDSMAPEYPNGSQVFIKRINEKAFIDWGRVYVLDTCNGTVIKILVPSEKEGYVKCISINDNPIYAPFEVALKDIYGIYRVILCMSVK